MEIQLSTSCVLHTQELGGGLKRADGAFSISSLLCSHQCSNAERGVGVVAPDKHTLAQLAMLSPRY